MGEGGEQVTAERREEVAGLLVSVVREVGRRPEVTAIGLCGSWAAGRERMSSDVDLIVVTDDRAKVAGSPWIVAAVDGAEVVRRQSWGPFLTELRVRRRSGLEVELGLVDPAWAEVDPVDAGTAGVVAGGFEVLHDPHGVLGALVAAVGA